MGSEPLALNEPAVDGYRVAEPGPGQVDHIPPPGHVHDPPEAIPRGRQQYAHVPRLPASPRAATILQRLYGILPSILDPC
jgi:hypothetical protein